MSQKYNAGLNLFAGCDSLFQELTPAQESTIAGGRRTRTRGRTRTRS